MSYSPFDRNPSGIVFFTNGGTEPVFDSDSNFILATGSPGYIKSPNLRIGDGGNIGSVSDPDAISIASNGNVSLSQSLSIAGDLVVNGTTTTVNSTVVTIEDPIIVLGSGSPTTDDNKDRGVSFNYYSGSAKTGFFGFDDSAGKFTFIPDATIAGEVVSGTAGTIVANLEGNVTGNASTATTATNVTATANNSTNESTYITFVDGATGAQGIETDDSLRYNPSTNTLTVANFAGTATNATNVIATANNSTNETTYITFIDGVTGAQGIETDTGLTYNPSTNTITASIFSGNLSGSAATLTTSRYIGASGHMVGSGLFNGSADQVPNVTLHPTAISSQTAITSVDGVSDYLLIWDATDSQLKKVTRSNFVSGLGSMSNFIITDGTTPQTIDDGESITFADGVGAEFVVSATNTITVNSVDSEIVHDNLSGFVANEHINHSSISITAGSGLTGGGDITTTRTINVVGGDGITVNADEVEVTVDNSTIELSATNGTGAIRVKDGGITFAKLAGAAVQLSTEAFADNDTSLMTSAAIQDKILSYGYSTTTGTVTSVGGTGSVNGITLTGTVTSAGNLTLGGTLGNITVSQLAGSSVQTGTEVGSTGGSIGDNDTSLLTAAAIINYVEGKNYSTTTGTVTSVATGTGLTGGTITTTGTISIANGGVDTTQLANGAVTEAKRERSYSGVNTSSTASSYLTTVDADTLPITITLPSTPANGSIYTIKKIDASTNPVTISRSGSQTIDGSTSKILYSQWESISLFYSGGDKWFVI